ACGSCSLPWESNDMPPKLDELLMRSAESNSTLERARAAVTAELRQGAGPSWKASALKPVIAAWLSMIAVAAGLIAAGDATPFLASRLPLIVSLAMLTGLSGWLAVAPLSRAAPITGTVIGLLAAFGLV